MMESIRHKNAKMRKSIHTRILSFMLCVAMLLTTMPELEIRVKADAPAILYIIDGSGDQTKVTSDASGTGWSYDLDNNKLTLNGFNGSYIEADEDLNILLINNNSITLPSDGSKTAGLKVNDTATITAESGGSLTITADYLETTDQNLELVNGKLVIDSGNVTLNGTNAGNGREVTGVTSTVEVNGSATFNVTLSGEGTVSGTLDKLTANTTEDVDITITNCKSNTNSQCVYALNCLGSGDVSLSIPDQEYAKVIASGDENAFVIVEDAGDVTLHGQIHIGYLAWRNLPATRVITDKATTGYWIYDYYNGRGTFLVDAGKKLITDAVFKKSTNTPLTVAPVTWNLTGMKVGKEVNSYDSVPNGLVNLINASYGGGNKDYYFTLKEGSEIPEGLVVQPGTGCIQGTPTETHAAGSFVVLVSDSSSPAKTTEVTVTYDAIEEADRNITVYDTASGTTFQDNTNAGEISGSWHYDKDNKILTLNNYSGGPILSDSDLSIKLTGDNTITIPADGSLEAGIKVPGATTITAESSGNLTITADYSETTDKNLNLVSGKLVIDSGSVTLNGKHSKGGCEVTGVTGTVEVNGAATFNATLSGEGTVTGTADSLTTDTTGNVNISITKCKSYTSSKCAYSLNCLGSGSVTLSIPDQAYAKVIGNSVDEDSFVIAEDAGDVTLQGRIQMSYLAWEKLPATRVITDKAAAGYRIYLYGNEGTYLVDAANNLITDASFVRSTNTPLTVAPVTWNLTGMKVGTKVNSYDSTNGLVNLINATYGGGEKPYRYALKEGSELPAGLNVQPGTGCIQGTPTEIHSAGSFVVLVSDSSTPVKTTEVTVNYDAIGVTKAVTGITVDPANITISKGATAGIEAKVLPDDASVLGAAITSASSPTASVSDVALNGNKTTATITGVAPGKTKITARSNQGEFTADCQVTVTEAIPMAVAATGEDGMYLSGLVAGASYMINETTYTADSSGIITGFPDSLIGTVISVVKTNEDEDLNSPAQSIDLSMSKILLTESYVIVSGLSKTYSGDEQEPTFGGSLTRGADYTVSYKVKPGEAGKLGENGKPQEVGVYVLTVTGMGNYSGSFTKEMTISAVNHVHTLIHHARVEAKGNVPGNIEYWECIECNKYFSDENGKNEINAKDIVIPAKNGTTSTPTPSPGTDDDVTPSPTPGTGEDVTPTPTPGTGDDITPTPTPALKEGEVYISPEDAEAYVTPAKVSMETPVSATVDGETVSLNLKYDYTNAVTYTGEKIAPNGELIKAKLDLSDITSQVSANEGVKLTQEELFTVSYKISNNKDASRTKKASFYARIKINKGVNKQMPKAEYRKLQKLVSAANKLLKANKCEFTINPKPITECSPEIIAKFKKDGSVKTAKKTGLLSGEKVYVSLSKKTKLSKKMYTMEAPVTGTDETITVKLTGKKNYTGTAVVTIEK